MVVVAKKAAVVVQVTEVVPEIAVVDITAVAETIVISHHK